MSRLTLAGRSPSARRCPVVLAVAAGLEAVALIVTPGAPPIYDGIGFPDEPYRFVAPPANYRDTQPATTATRQLSLADGHSGGAATVSSAETGPQISLYLPAGSVRATSPDAHEATVSAAPLSPVDRSVPGHPWGNVYRLSITADVG
ncbi:MAG: hypothetical protein QOJ03_2814, partial [Frankiaceae bacterium]|nr:hypothetical protein [Frankiaceae bacterium]